MKASQLASHILLTKYMLLVLCVHLCAALDHYSFYRGLKIKDIATTMPLSTMCECHNACRVMISCTAATHVRESGSEPKCLISETLGICKTDLEPANADTHTTVIKGYQVKFVDEWLKFTAAKQACLDMGMRLATPSDAASRDLLTKIHKERYGNTRDDWFYWADATQVDSDTWRWGDGVEFTAEVGADPWKLGFPNGYGNCSVLYPRGNFRLIDGNCIPSRRFACTP